MLPAPVFAAEFGGYFAGVGSLPADIEGDGEDVEELMPFV